MHPRSEAIFMNREFLGHWRFVQNSSCRNARRQVKNDLVLGAFPWPVFTRPSLAAFHLTAEVAAAPPFEKLAAREWQPLLRANIEGVFAITQSVIPSTRINGWGRILNVTSILAEDGLPGAGWYSLTKSSLHGLTRTLSKELGPLGILVNSVMPELTNTERLKTASPAAIRRITEGLPIRRVLQPDEVAAAIVFLCSAANSAITGEILRVSGGRI